MGKWLKVAKWECVKLTDLSLEVLWAWCREPPLYWLAAPFRRDLAERESGLKLLKKQHSKSHNPTGKCVFDFMLYNKQHQSFAEKTVNTFHFFMVSFLLDIKILWLAQFSVNDERCLITAATWKLLVLHLKEDVEDVEQDPEAIHGDDLSCQVGFASSSRPCSCSLASAYGLCVVGPGGSGPRGSLTSALRSHLTVQHWREPSWACSEEPNGSQCHRNNLAVERHFIVWFF